MITINYPITPDDHQKLLKGWNDLATRAKGFGITLDHSGEFTGKAEGHIRIGTAYLTIEIERKPFYVPEFAIRNELTKMLTEFFG